MRWRLFSILGFSLASPFLLASCDQITDRFGGDQYQLSKDEKGRTLRLNKRTGEIAIVENGRIVTLRDAKEEERQEAEKTRRLGEFKYWKDNDVPQFKVTASLTTVWRDGRAWYSVSFRGIAPKKDAPSNKQATSEVLKPDVISKVQSHTFFLLLLDVPFELARETLSFSQLVNSEEKPTGWEARGNIVMSRESYERLDVWNIEWRRRF